MDTDSPDRMKRGDSPGPWVSRILGNPCPSVSNRGSSALSFLSLIFFAVVTTCASADQATSEQEPVPAPSASAAAAAAAETEAEAPVLGGRGAPIVPPAEAAPATTVLPTAADPNNLTPAESMAWRDLRDAVMRERAIWERLRARPDDDLEQQRAQAEFRTVMNAYENVIRAAPRFAEAYAAYGLLLSRTGNREEAVRACLKANQLNPNLPMVKNQIGNYLIEEGRYKDALGYYLAAIQLKPDEPLYHYQLGSLLREYRKFLVVDGLYTSAKIDKLMQEAFREAARLAPENWGYIYRFAESYYDLETPQWDAALAEWTRLAEKAQPGVERQTIHLHQANVLTRLGRRDEARLIVDSIVEPSLQAAKAEVLAMIDPPPAEDNAVSAVPGVPVEQEVEQEEEQQQEVRASEG